jgi:hypothetical protein
MTFSRAILLLFVVEFLFFYLLLSLLPAFLFPRKKKLDSPIFFFYTFKDHQIEGHDHEDYK